MAQSDASGRSSARWMLWLVALVALLAIAASFSETVRRYVDECLLDPHTLHCSLHDGELVVAGSAEVGPNLSYSGIWRHRQPNGNGRLTTAAGVTIDGFFVDGTVIGTVAYDDHAGFTFSGSLEELRPTGKGVGTWTDGRRYEGGWRGGQPAGDGAMVWRDGATYTGQWQAGQMDGEGKLVRSDGRRHEGHFVANQADGDGIETLTSGVTVKGTWSAGSYACGPQLAEQPCAGDRSLRCWRWFHMTDDLRCSAWLAEVPADIVGYELSWTGNCEDCRATGTGVLSFVHARADAPAAAPVVAGTLAAPFVAGRAQGSGVYTDQGTVIYRGDFNRGLAHGQGYRVYPGGTTYDGPWEEGERSGARGTMTWSDGAVYVGAWASGKRSGPGTMTWADASTYEGQWEDGQIADPAGAELMLLGRCGTSVSRFEPQQLAIDPPEVVERSDNRWVTRMRVTNTGPVAVQVDFGVTVTPKQRKASLGTNAKWAGWLVGLAAASNARNWDDVASAAGAGVGTAVVLGSGHKSRMEEANQVRRVAASVVVQPGSAGYLQLDTGYVSNEIADITPDDQPAVAWPHGQARLEDPNQCLAATLALRANTLAVSVLQSYRRGCERGQAAWCTYLDASGLGRGPADPAMATSVPNLSALQAVCQPDPSDSLVILACWRALVVQIVAESE